MLANLEILKLARAVSMLNNLEILKLARAVSMLANLETLIYDRITFRNHDIMNSKL